MVDVKLVHFTHRNIRRRERECQIPGDRPAAGVRRMQGIGAGQSQHRGREFRRVGDHFDEKAEFVAGDVLPRLHGAHDAVFAIDIKKQLIAQLRGIDFGDALA